MLIPRLLNAHTERVALTEHLLRLTHDDLHARFGSYADSGTVTAYVDGLLDRGDPVLIVEDRRATGHIVAALHVAPLDDGSAELGLSVDPAWRRHGLGQTLLRAGGVLAHCLGLRRLRLEIAPDNRPMRLLAERARFVLTHGPDGELTGLHELSLDETLAHGWLWWLASVEYLSRRPCPLLRRASRRAGGRRRRASEAAETRRAAAAA